MCWLKIFAENWKCQRFDWKKLSPKYFSTLNSFCLHCTIENVHFNTIFFILKHQCNINITEFQEISGTRMKSRFDSELTFVYMMKLNYPTTKLMGNFVTATPTSGLKTGVENCMFWSEIGSGIGEPGSTPLPRIPKNTPSPRGRSANRMYWVSWGTYEIVPTVLSKWFTN